MMRPFATCCAAIVIMVIGIEPARAQTRTSTTPTFSFDVSVPDDPAFSILGVSPTNIERPTTPSALAVSLLSSAGNNANFLPNNYAVQVAPYWLGRPQVQLFEYLEPSVGQSIAQTFSASFAAAKAGKSGAADDHTDTSVGFRTSILAGRGSSALLRGLASLLVVSTQVAALRGLRDDVGLLARPDPRSTASGRPKTAWPEVTASAAQWTAALTANLEAQFPGGNPTATAIRSFFSQPTKTNLNAWLKAVLEEAFGSIGPPKDVTERIVSNQALNSLYQTELESARQRTMASLETVIEQVYLADDVATLVLLSNPPASPVALNAVAVRLLAAIDAPLEALRTSLAETQNSRIGSVQAADKVRRGLILTIFAAAGWRVPNDSFGDGRLLRWAAWIAPAYRTDGSQLEIIGVLKVIQRRDSEGPNLFDAGGRIVKQAGRAAISAEFLERMSRTSAETRTTSERATINFDYRFNDKLHLTAAFGRDFADPSASQAKGGLISVLGVNVGFVPAPTVTPPVK